MMTSWYPFYYKCWTLNEDNFGNIENFDGILIFAKHNGPRKPIPTPWKHCYSEWNIVRQLTIWTCAHVLENDDNRRIILQGLEEFSELILPPERWSGEVFEVFALSSWCRCRSRARECWNHLSVPTFHGRSGWSSSGMPRCGSLCNCSRSSSSSGPAPLRWCEREYIYLSMNP